MPNKYYQVEFKLDKKWEFITRELTHTRALEYITKRKSHDYPFRIVRVTRTIVFEEKR